MGLVLCSYRANLWALKQLGANVILATTAVGSLSPDFVRGNLVVFGKKLAGANPRPALLFYR